MSNSLSWCHGLSRGRLVELACLLEVTASKPGNVHRGADFEDVSFIDFATSAVAMGQAIDESAGKGYGQTVLAVANRTLAVAGSNTNLGINLLLSLLVQASRQAETLDVDAAKSVLNQLDGSDAADVYAAIRKMSPGGIGQTEVHDVNDSAPASLIDAMDAAKDRDVIAAQFTNGFADVFRKILPWILDGRDQFNDLVHGIVWAHVRLMATHPDSLIARKCGSAVAEQSQAMASTAIESLANGPESFFAAVANLDFWLRADGHRRNPGTTADMIAAGLFVGLYNGDIVPPFTKPPFAS
ncbi:triphosphoribosyl-dephospho-CoA synthase [Mariniblastus fucicola]|uniref:ATP:dephospho-CoA triphosphoribosyl transferase n=1 Tax=Mariniblastus fucicola TaxID=980251 RepID=A0A5B9PFT2_9BACT|nr:triphosphoribosyl-dephospho-CoA synthase [Mariniblastus fucicola]QEG23496.1 ATP:dephospho-CoA triphosphoribosyl transferase [Mariniblastus fucicola]